MILGLAVAIMGMPAAPATAAGAGATMGMPFAGWWDRFGFSHPSSHGPAGNNYADWAVDIYQAPGTPVRPRFTGPGLALKVASVGPTCGSAGQTVRIDVHTNGQFVGTARYGHLSGVGVVANQWIGPDTVIGHLARYPQQAGCWEVTSDSGVHTHVTGFNNADYSCYHDVGSRSFLGDGHAIGIVGGAFASRALSRCSGQAAGSSPFGSYDVATVPEAGRVRVAGWAIDDDARTTPVVVHAYVGGEAGTAGSEGHDLGPADRSRPDVGAAHPGAGDHHGFDAEFVTAKVGHQNVCLYAIDVASSAGHRLLGCRAVTIPDPRPFGGFDEATGGAGSVRVRGWVVDRNSATTPSRVHVYIGGPAGTAGAQVHDVVAGSNRPDVAAAHPWAGAAHGFDTILPTDKRGTQQVCAYGINAGPGDNQLLGCRTTSVAAGSSFQPLPPARVLDTRSGLGARAGVVGPSGVVTLKVAGVGGVPVTGVTAVAMNVTAVNAVGGSYATVYPSGQSRPQASNLNFTSGATSANLVIVKVGSDGAVDLYNNTGDTHLIADVAGYYTR